MFLNKFYIFPSLSGTVLLYLFLSTLCSFKFCHKSSLIKLFCLLLVCHKTTWFHDETYRQFSSNMKQLILQWRVPFLGLMAAITKMSLSYLIIETILEDRYFKFLNNNKKMEFQNDEKILLIPSMDEWINKMWCVIWNHGKFWLRWDHSDRGKRIPK